MGGNVSLLARQAERVAEGPAALDMIASLVSSFPAGLVVIAIICAVLLAWAVVLEIESRNK